MWLAYCFNYIPNPHRNWQNELIYYNVQLCVLFSSFLSVEFFFKNFKSFFNGFLLDSITLFHSFWICKLIYKKERHRRYLDLLN